MAPALATNSVLLKPGCRCRSSSHDAASTRDGAVITGSVGPGGIYRAAPGASIARPWISAGDNALLDSFGVLADEASGSLWVCSLRLDPPAAGLPIAVSALYRDDLASGRVPQPSSIPW